MKRNLIIQVRMNNFTLHIKFIRKLFYGFASAVVFLSAYGCDGDYNKEVRIDVKNKRMHVMLMQELKDASIPFKTDSKYKLIINEKDYYRVSVLQARVGEKVLPGHRSGLYPTKLQIEIENTLKKNNFYYEVICFDGQEWIVWSENDAVLVRKLIDDTMEKALDRIMHDAALADEKIDLSENTLCNN